MTNQEHEHKWWKEGVVYQIYPSSFKDSNDDGIGDIPGIISKLDYVRDLGADIIWVSPHYKSPQVDMGYDISDYEDIYERYGTVKDCEDLIKATHDRGMRIIFDLVINHTSDLHAWFQESRSSKTNPKRDWYIWRPAKYDSNGKRLHPNNWRSNFSKPAWTWDEHTQEYYLHLYAEEQPDLNWENEYCRRAIYASAMRFWLDKGIDGFRIDTVNMYSKHPGLPDASVKFPGAETQPAYMYYCNGPKMHEYLSEMNTVLAPYDTMTVGELPYTPDSADVMSYISAKANQLDMVFNFDVVDLGQTPGSRFDLRSFTNKDFQRELFKWQSVIQGTDAWTTVFLENHDQGRSVSRFASDHPAHRVRSAKMLAIILATLTGTLFIYQGQEIGMVNAPLSWAAEDYKCIKSVSYLDEVRSRSYPTLADRATAFSEAIDSLQKVARDHARVPMHWEGASYTNAGFCGDTAKPWMRVLESHSEINVADQVGRKDSVLEFWKRMLVLRKKEKDLLVYGDFSLADGDRDGDIMVFVKEGANGRRAVTVANLSGERKAWTMPEWVKGTPNNDSVLELVVENTDDSEEGGLEPYEARVYMSET